MIKYCYCSENKKGKCRYCAAKFEINRIASAGGELINYNLKEESMTEVFDNYDIAFTARFDILDQVREMGKNIENTEDLEVEFTPEFVDDEDDGETENTDGWMF